MTDNLRTQHGFDLLVVLEMYYTYQIRPLFFSTNQDTSNYVSF